MGVAEGKAQRKVPVSRRVATPCWEQQQVRRWVSGGAGEGGSGSEQPADMGLVWMSYTEGGLGRPGPAHSRRELI